MASTKKTADTSDVKLSDQPGKADTAGMTEDNLTPATDVAASGALIEPEIVERVDVDHPAVDNAPRKGQPRVANQIDFNDPSKTDSEAVAENLKSSTAAEDAAEKAQG